ncbi:MULTISPECIES: methionine gamma-lyase [unclassified Sporosarcina]|uniref:methionine gamma-lyase n=1 Tax=unclassified Sporosarcina TaxID=2647733 RepID=UPI000C168FB1|nr:MULTISPECIES: methionine gamma-lyase [unclassified Sporosarcina]PID00799.1 methionine gamma-lyase [Sporosarcina sp. P29]PID07142.1 methionine gamma-lyase [Sporosarcina sp. P30]PID10338.1 methionine gamma-lyase [Sporosarcina sp. P31]PID12922.1 methionine gamma-lyase [Sporosarcina sp. P32b]
MKKNNNWHKETAMIHEGYDSKDHQGSLAVPLYQTSTYVFDSAEQGERRFAGEEAGNIYSRLGNPTVAVLEERIAKMEEGAAGLAFASGMAAVSAVLVHLTKANDHVICSRGIYGCTFGFLKILEEKYNITHDLISMKTEQEIEKAVKPETTCIYVETPINPTMELVDLEAVVNVAKRHNLKVVVDNTFCSPYIQTPLTFGVDYVLHSATKYINGHGDVIAGLLVGKDADDMAKLRGTVQKDFGGIISPFDAWLLLRGIKTLPIRMDRHSANAKIIFDYLQKHPKVEEVFYPFDDQHPQYAIAKKQMKTGGGLISFTIKGGKEDAQKLLNHLSLIKLAVSLGDAETLMQHPATMTHSAVPKEDREKMGVSDTLLRLSVGLEHMDDIMADLDQAFEAI